MSIEEAYCFNVAATATQNQRMDRSERWIVLLLIDLIDAREICPSVHTTWALRMHPLTNSHIDKQILVLSLNFAEVSEVFQIMVKVTTL